MEALQKSMDVQLPHVSFSSGPPKTLLRKKNTKIGGVFSFWGFLQLFYPKSPIIMVQWKITLDERKLALEIHPFSISQRAHPPDQPHPVEEPGPSQG